jgi:hypothetical protein
MSSGIKKFVDYTSLTAFDINEYLMNQTVMVFASSAARTTAFSTAGVTITEGMVTYLLDTNMFDVWDGSAWAGLTVASVTASGRITTNSGGQQVWVGDSPLYTSAYSGIYSSTNELILKHASDNAIYLVSKFSKINLRAGGADSLIVNTNNIVQHPYVPAFTVYCGYLDGHAAIGDGVFTATTVPLNNGSHFRTSGAGAYQNFYAPVAGYYHFDFNWTIIGGTAGYYYGAYFQVDGTTTHGGYVNYFKHAGGNDDAAASITSNFYLAANQYVRVAINNQNAVRFQFARFSGHLIG